MAKTTFTITFEDGTTSSVTANITDAKTGIKVKERYYSYRENRNYAKYNEFEANTFKALDKLYATGAMIIDFGGKVGVVNVLDKLIDNIENYLLIVETKKVTTHNLGKVKFNPFGGVVIPTKPNISYSELEKVAETGVITNGTGLNSPTAQLGHDILHGYNRIFDRGREGYNKKKRKYTKGIGYEGRKIDFDPQKEEPSFSNGEEKYTTILGNQINYLLKESQRYGYKGVLYKTESPTSTRPFKN